MRIVIVGLGKVGKSLVEQLSGEEHDLVVIDSDPDVVTEISNLRDVLGVTGNGASWSVQKEAGVAGSDLLIACTPNDEVNILTCLVAKKLGVDHTIARIRNPEYDQQLRLMRSELGLSMSINPERSVAREIARVLRFPNAQKLESFSRRRLDLLEYRIEEKSPLDGMRIMSIVQKFRVKVLICAVSRDKEIFIPMGDFELRGGDRIFLTASPAELERFFRIFGLFRHEARRIMIIGASKMSYYLATELTEAGIEVTIIDIDEERCRRFSELLPRALMIVGDGTDAELLKEERIGEMDAFVALTGLDETNILLALYAQRSGVPKTIAKVNRTSFSQFVSEEDMLGTIVSTGPTVAEIVAQYIRAMSSSRGSKIKALHRIADSRVEALEFGVTESTSHLGVPLKDLKLKKDLLIGGIVRESGRIVIPGGNDCFMAGDDVIVVTTDQTLRDLEDIFEE